MGYENPVYNIIMQINISENWREIIYQKALAVGKKYNRKIGGLGHMFNVAGNFFTKLESGASLNVDSLITINALLDAELKKGTNKILPKSRR